MELLEPVQEKTILEIGPGRGFLTEDLCQLCPVVALEKDDSLIPELQRLPITLLHGDALDFPLETLSFQEIVSNVPYHITKPLLLRLEKYRHLYTKLVVMVQKEVADKLVSPFAHTFFVSRMQASFDITYHFFVPRSVFAPKPRVDSAVISLIPLRGEIAPETVWNWMHQLYQKKRKCLTTSLRSLEMPLPAPHLWEGKRIDGVPTRDLISYLTSCFVQKNKKEKSATRYTRLE